MTPPATLDLIAGPVREFFTKLVEYIRWKAWIITGGVACNAGLRRAAAASQIGLPIYFPTPGLSTDNAAMIGAAAYRKLQAGDVAGLTPLATGACGSRDCAFVPVGIPR